MVKANGSLGRMHSNKSRVAGFKAKTYMVDLPRLLVNRHTFSVNMFTTVLLHFDGNDTIPLN